MIALNFSVLRSTANEDTNAFFWIGISFLASILAVFFFMKQNYSFKTLSVIFMVLAFMSCAVYIFRIVAKRKNINVERKYGRWCRIFLCLPPEKKDPVAYYKAHCSSNVQAEQLEVNSQEIANRSK